MSNHDKLSPKDRGDQEKKVTGQSRVPFFAPVNSTSLPSISKDQLFFSLKESLKGFYSEQALEGLLQRYIEQYPEDAINEYKRHLFDLGVVIDIGNEEKLKEKIRKDWSPDAWQKCAKRGDSVMSYVYLVCNVLATGAAICVNALSGGTWSLISSGLAIFWNYIDVLGAGAVAAEQAKKGEIGLARVNRFAAAQLFVFTTLQVWQLPTIHLFSSSVVTSVAAIGSPFGFAACMLLAAANEQWEIQKAEKRIGHIEALKETKIDDIRQLISELPPRSTCRSINVKSDSDCFKLSRYFLDELHHLQSLKTAAQEEKTTPENLKNYYYYKNKIDQASSYDIDDHIAKLANIVNELELVERFSRSINIEQSFIQSHKNARNAWAFCFVAMTAIAVVGFLGLNVVTGGAPAILMFVAASLLCLASAVYRLYQSKKTVAKSEESTDLTETPSLGLGR